MKTQELKYKVGDRVVSSDEDFRGPGVIVREDPNCQIGLPYGLLLDGWGRKNWVWVGEKDLKPADEVDHKEDALGYLQTYPLGLDCDVPIIPEPTPTEDDKVLERIGLMLCRTSLCANLDMPEPYEVDMSFTDLEYIEWILWRCEAMVARMKAAE